MGLVSAFVVLYAYTSTSYACLYFHVLLFASQPLQHDSTFTSFKVAVSKGAALVIAVLQQWLIRYMCKSLMQLMTPEALALHQQKIPISYRRSYLLYQDHFSLKDLITKYWERVSNGNRYVFLYGRLIHGHESTIIYV